MARNAIKGITVEIDGNTTKLNTALKSVNSTLYKSQEGLRDINKLLKMDPGNADLLRQKQQYLSEAIDATREKIQTEQAALEQLKTAGDSTKTIEQQRALEREITELNSKLQQLEQQARQSASVLGAQMQAAGQKIQAAGEKISQAGQHLNTRLTLPLLALGAAAGKTTSDFDTSMSKVRALSGATGEDFEALRNKARELGSETKYSASEAADAMGELSLAGWNTEQMLSGIGGVLDLAAAGDLELAQAANIVSGNLAAFNMQASESSKLADILATAQAKSKTTAEQMGEAWNNSATTLTRAGQRVETTTALLEGMASVNDTGSAAGTKLNAVMAQMTQKMDDGAIAIGKARVQVMDAAGNFRDLIDIIADVEAATYSMGDAERAAALGATFNRTSLQGLNELLAVGSDKLREYRTDLENSAGSAKEMAEVMQDNLAGQLTVLKSQTEELAISLGDLLVPKARSVVSVAQEAVTWISSLDDGAKNMVVNAGLVAAAAGPVLSVGGKLVTTAGKLVSGAGELVTLASSAGVAAGLLVVPLAGVAAGIASLIAEHKKLKELGTGEETILGAYDNVKSLEAALESAEAAASMAGDGTRVASTRLVEASAAVENARSELDLLRSSEEAQLELLQRVSAGEISAADAAEAMGISVEALQHKMKNQESAQLASTAAARDSSDALAVLSETEDALADSAEGLDESTQDATQVLGTIGTAAYAAIRDNEDLRKNYEDLKEQMDKLEDGGDAYIRVLAEQALYTLNLAATNQELTVSYPEYVAAIREAGFTVTELSGFLIDNGLTAEEWGGKVRSAVGGVVNGFSEVGTSLDMTLDEMYEHLQNNVSAYQTWSGNIQSLMDAAVANQDAGQIAFVQQLQDMGVGAAQQVSQMMDDVDGALERFGPLMEDAAKAGVSGVYNGIESESAQVRGAAQTVMEDVLEATESVEGYQEAGQAHMDEVAEGMEDGAPEVENAARRTVEDARGAAESVGGWYDIGYNIPSGIASGVWSGSGVLSAAVRSTVQSALAAGRDEAQVHSPSRLFRDKLGAYIPEGVAAGITQREDLVAQSVRSMIDRAAQITEDGRFTGTGNAAGASVLASGIGQNSMAVSPYSPQVHVVPAAGSSVPSVEVGQMLTLLQTYMPQIANMQVVMSDGTMVGWMDSALGQRAAAYARGNA